MPPPPEDMTGGPSDMPPPPPGMEGSDPLFGDGAPPPDMEGEMPPTDPMMADGSPPPGMDMDGDGMPPPPPPEGMEGMDEMAATMDDASAHAGPEIDPSVGAEDIPLSEGAGDMPPPATDDTPDEVV